MKAVFLTISCLTAMLLFASCYKPEPKEVLEETFRFRRNAVDSQTQNLVDNIGATYTDSTSVKHYLDTFIRQNPQVTKVSLISLPLIRHPFAVNIWESLRAAPEPINKYLPCQRFDWSPDMVWYRMLLHKKVAFWYQQDKEKSDYISYVHPVFNKLEPEVIYYVLKFDYDKNRNPVLFWNVPKRLYNKDLLKQEKEYLKKYVLLRKAAEKREMQAEADHKKQEADSFYQRRSKELQEQARERDKLFREQHPHAVEELNKLEEELEND